MRVSQTQKKNFLSVLSKQFIEKKLFMMASSLTTTTLLAVVPVMVVLFSIISILPWSRHLSVVVQDFIFNNFVPDSGHTIQRYITLFMAQSKRLPIVSIIFLFIISIMLTVSIEKVFNTIWGVKGRRFNVLAWLYYWMVLIFAGVIMVLALGASSYLFSLPYISKTIALWGGTAIVVNTITFLLTVLAFTLLYKIVPHHRVLLRHAVWSAMVTAILLSAVKYLFIFYIRLFPTYQVIYGALAIIPIFIVWVSLSWLIILFGVLLNSVLDEQRWRKRQ